jgi:hypothetical protein
MFPEFIAMHFFFLGGTVPDSLPVHPTVLYTQYRVLSLKYTSINYICSYSSDSHSTYVQKGFVVLPKPNSDLYGCPNNNSTI